MIIHKPEQSRRQSTSPGQSRSARSYRVKFIALNSILHPAINAAAFNIWKKFLLNVFPPNKKLRTRQLVAARERSMLIFRLNSAPQTENKQSLHDRSTCGTQNLIQISKLIFVKKKNSRSGFLLTI